MRDLGVFLEYNGLKGSVLWNEADKRYFGKIMDISSLFAYNGKNYEGLDISFRKAVDSYIDLIFETPFLAS